MKIYHLYRKVIDLVLHLHSQYKFSTSSLFRYLALYFAFLIRCGSRLIATIFSFFRGLIQSSPTLHTSRAQQSYYIQYQTSNNSIKYMKNNPKKKPNFSHSDATCVILNHLLQIFGNKWALLIYRWKPIDINQNSIY